MNYGPGYEKRTRPIPAGIRVRILRGKLKGRIVVVHQSANDWILAEKPYKIFGKSSVEEVEDRSAGKGDSNG
jgi:hypothetical protein